MLGSQNRKRESRMLLLLSRFSRVRLFATPWTAAYQAPPSMGFPRQESWSGLPLPSPRSPEWQWLKDKEEKSPQKQNKARSEDLSEDLRQNKQHSWLDQFTQGRPRGRKYIKRGAKGLGGLSLACALGRSSLHIFGLACPHASRIDFPAIF